MFLFFNIFIFLLSFTLFFWEVKDCIVSSASRYTDQIAYSEHWECLIGLNRTFALKVILQMHFGYVHLLPISCGNTKGAWLIEGCTAPIFLKTLSFFKCLRYSNGFEA